MGAVSKPQVNIMAAGDDGYQRLVRAVAFALANQGSLVIGPENLREVANDSWYFEPPGAKPLVLLGDPAVQELEKISDHPYSQWIEWNPGISDFWELSGQTYEDTVSLAKERIGGYWGGIIGLDKDRFAQDIDTLLAMQHDPWRQTTSGDTSSGHLALNIMRKATTEAGVPLSWADQEGLWKLLYGESGSTIDKLNTTAQNPTSTAYGAFQFLDQTWGLPGIDGHKTSDPHLQCVYGLRYIKIRPDYTDPNMAYTKWLARDPHWY